MRPSGSYLLDTNIVIALLTGEARVANKLVGAARAAVPIPVLGELYFGAFKSSRAAENLVRLEQMASAWFIVDCDRVTAREYGLIKSQLKAAGSPIPENDIWIAAAARQHDFVLVTRDEHFKSVKGLKLARW